MSNDQKPTNFCASMECLCPLTPDDIHTHLEHHQSSGTPPIIQSIKNTKINCEKKLTQTINELKKGMDDQDFSYVLQPDEMYTQEVKKMDQCREIMFEIINIYIETQKKKLKSSIDLNLLKVKDIKGVFTEINEVINQLEQLKRNLENPDPFPAINKCCRLDVKTMTDRYKSMVKKVMTTRDLEPITVHIDDQALYQLNRQLKQILYVIDHAEGEETNYSQKGNIKSGLSEHHDMDDHHSQHSIPNSQNRPSNQNHFTQGVSPLHYPPQPHPDSAPYQTIDDLFSITVPDFFEPKAPRFLHFFKNDDTVLFILDLNQITHLPRFKQIRLNQKFIVPQFHRSIVTPKGEIYLSGGTNQDSTKSNIIYTYDPNKQQLVDVSRLSVARSSHAMVYVRGQIYIISGFTQGSQLTSSVEKFDPLSGKTMKVADCQQPSNSPTCCAFANKYIYKFGGNNQDGSLVQIVERYDIDSNRWEHIDPKMDEQDLNNFEQIYQYAACCQISRQSIIVFGGYDHDNNGTQFSFLLSQEDDESNSILGTNVKPLPTPEGFWSNQCITIGGKLYVLQNVDIEGEVVETKRRILCFDGHKWSDLGEGQ